MAWLRYVAPSARHPRERWQVRYRDSSGKERSAGIYNTPKAVETARKRIERGLPPTLEVTPTDIDAAKAQTLFGNYGEKGVVADLEGPASRVGLPDRQTHRKAHPEVLLTQ